MKSICIKTNNENLLNYLLNELDYIEIKPVVISTNKFKNYKNIIIHYSGNEIKRFIHEVSCILACLVIDELEESFIKKLILKNYFYFNNHITHYHYGRKKGKPTDPHVGTADKRRKQSDAL